MGSLMSGWSCPAHDPKQVKYMRNWSMTRVEIDAYWKSKKKTDGEDGENSIKSVSSSPSPSSLPTTPSSTRSTDSKMVFGRSMSMPMERTSSSNSNWNPNSSREHHLDAVSSLKQSSCWWTASNSAFLNEPPVLNNEPTESPRRRTYNYTPDYTTSSRGGCITSTRSNLGIVT